MKQPIHTNQPNAAGFRMPYRRLTRQGIAVSIAILFQLSSLSAAINFDGVDDQVSCGTFNPSSSDLSISLWIAWNGDDDDDNTIISKYDTWAADEMMWQLSYNSADEKLYFNCSSNWNTYFQFALTVDTWQHIVIVHNSGGNDVLYVDGSVEDTKTAVTFGTGTTSEIYISGNGDDDGMYGGLISEVYIYSRALGASEISSLAGGVKRVGLQFANLEAYWPLDDVAHGSAANGATMRDISDNEHDASATDGPNNTGCTGAGEELSYP